MQSQNSPAKSIALSGILVALALLFSYIEHLIPIPVPVPGVRLGLANLVTLMGIFFLNPIQVFCILTARILLSGFMFGNLTSILYSLAGGLVSLTFMYFIKHLKVFSPLGISISGGVIHNIAQLAVAAIMLKSTSIILYLPALLIAGAVAGTVIGIVGRYVSEYINKKRG